MSTADYNNARLPVRDLSCKNPSRANEAEVRVDVKDGDEWVRIPVTLCEQWINKDGPSDLTRTAKVEFPAEWNGEDIAQYINGFSVNNPDSPYDECRIWFYDFADDIYQIAHYGYIGGVGPAAENGQMKFWVYDPADLMRGIPVSKTFGEVNINQMLNLAVRGYDNNGGPIGLEHRSVFDNVGTFIAGLQEISYSKREGIEYEGEELTDDGFVLEGELPVVGSFQLDVDEIVDDILETVFDDLDRILDELSEKQFQRNRNNLVDVMSWFTAKLDAKWHFEPTPTRPVLFFDTTGYTTDDDRGFARRKFEDRELGAEDTGTIGTFADRDAFEPVKVVNNDALYDIKPFNSLYLHGEVPRSIADAVLPNQTSEMYPYAEVKYPPLIDNADGYEYAAPTVESGDTTLAEAERTARKQFRQHLEEETEGTITLEGEPYILPYDHITTIPVCNGTYENQNVDPMTYEVNSVKHSRGANQKYQTELGVSLTYSESDLNVTSEWREI